MREGRNGRAADLTLGEHTLINPVVIPAVMRCHLISPRRHSCIRIACKDGHGPLVVARPLRRIPRSRVSGTVVKQVELRIVCIPAPRGAAAEFPFFVFPRLETGIRADGLLRCPINSFRRIKQDVCIRTDTVGTPDEITFFKIVCADVAADTVLSSRDTHEYFVADNQRSASHRLTQFRITILGSPQHFAGFRVEGVELRI